MGTAGCPHHLQIGISSPATLLLPTPFCQEGTRKHKDQKQESGDLRPVQTLPLHGRRLHSYHLQFHTRRDIPSSSDLRFEVHFQSFDITCITPGTGRSPINDYREEGKEPLSGSSAGSSRGRSQHGGEGKVPRTD